MFVHQTPFSRGSEPPPRQNARESENTDLTHSLFISKCLSYYLLNWRIHEIILAAMDNGGSYWPSWTTEEGNIA